MNVKWLMKEINVRDRCYSFSYPLWLLNLLMLISSFGRHKAWWIHDQCFNYYLRVFWSIIENDLLLEGKMI